MKGNDEGKEISSAALMGEQVQEMKGGGENEGEQTKKRSRKGKTGWRDGWVDGWTDRWMGEERKMLQWLHLTAE